MIEENTSYVHQKDRCISWLGSSKAFHVLWIWYPGNRFLFLWLNLPVYMFPFTSLMFAKLEYSEIMAEVFTSSHLSPTLVIWIQNISYVNSSSLHTHLTWTLMLDCRGSVKCFAAGNEAWSLVGPQCYVVCCYPPVFFFLCDHLERSSLVGEGASER